jgi:hypothetical protein
MVLKRFASLAKRKPREEPCEEPCEEIPPLLSLPPELIDRVSFFLDSPDKAVLAVSNRTLYPVLRPHLAKMSAREKTECSRRLQISDWFRRQKLPCFACFEMHQRSRFSTSEMQEPMPHCIDACQERKRRREGLGELKVLFWKFATEEGSWEFETRMLKHFWKKRAARKERNRIWRGQVKST